MQGRTYRLKSPKESKSRAFTLQNGRQVAALRPRTQYRYRWAEAVCMTVNKEIMLTLYPIRSGDHWRKQ